MVKIKDWITFILSKYDFSKFFSVVEQINILKKDYQSLKYDVVKNQEYLLDLIKMNNNKGLSNEEKSYIDRSNLKIPVNNIEELKALESNAEQKKILVSFKYIL